MPSNTTFFLTSAVSTKSGQGQVAGVAGAASAVGIGFAILVLKTDGTLWRVDSMNNMFGTPVEIRIPR